MNEKIIKRRTRLWFSRNVGIDCWGYCNSLGNLWAIDNSYKKYTHKIGRKYKGSIRFRSLKDDKGAINSVEFLVYLTIILFLLFGGVDYYVTQVQLSGLEHIKDYYTDRMRIEGNLTEEARTELKTNLEKKDYKNIEINVLNNDGTAIDKTTVVTRNIDNPTTSILELQIKATPKFVPFMFGRFIGVKEDENFYFMVKGKVLSEKPM